MNNPIVNWLLDYYWAIPLAGVALLAYRFLGWRGLLAVVTLGAAGGIYTRGKRDERDVMERQAAEARSKAVAAKDGIDDEISKANPGDNRAKLKRWGLPNDDQGNSN